MPARATDSAIPEPIKPPPRTATFSTLIGAPSTLSGLQIVGMQRILGGELRQVIEAADRPRPVPGGHLAVYQADGSAGDQSLDLSHVVLLEVERLGTEQNAVDAGEFGEIDLGITNPLP